MVHSVQIILEDNLGGGPADETVQFGVDGRRSKIDLSTAKAEKLREAQGKAARATGPRSSSGGNPEAAKLRAWAKE